MIFFRRISSVAAAAAGLLLSTTVGLGAEPATAVAPGSPAASTANPDRPRLVVLLVFDQFRGDYIGRWRDLFGPDGFKRLTGDGAWYRNCHYPYSGTITGAGHASLLSGCTPSVHGILSNDWLRHDDGREVNCVNGPESLQVPPPPADEKPKDGATPRRFHAETFADVLKRETQGKGKVVALSMKSRSAVLPGGRDPDACYWFDDRLGSFVTSDYYRPVLHDWAEKFNAARPADAWWGKTWDRLRADIDYERYSSADDSPGEGSGQKQGKTFPHPMNGGAEAISEPYYEAVYTSPYSSELLWSFAQTALDAEQLGADDVPDLLSISFSANDAIGHQWGPDSQEVLDVTLRSDLIVADILRTLDAKVGKGRYVVALSADHGVCPIPEFSAAHGVDVARVAPTELRNEANKLLTKKFLPQQKDDEEPKKWISASTNNWLYLNAGVIEKAKADPVEVQRALVEWLPTVKGVEAAYPRDAFLKKTLPDTEQAKQAALSFDADKCGDVLVVLQPKWLWGTYGTGTTHGSPHPYDTWVPLVVFGHNVKPGDREEKVAPVTIGPIFSQALGFPAPKQTQFPAPAGLWK